MTEQQPGDVRSTLVPFPSGRPTIEGRRLEGVVLTATGIDRRLREMAPLPRTMDRDEATLARAIGAEVARRREEQGWSQTELAAAVRCDRSAVSRWEEGRRLPSLPHLVTLGRVLGCGARTLLPPYQ